MIQFSTLGCLRLTGGDADRLAGLLAQPKRIALLAYLALARPRGFHSRDTIRPLFWPELDGRHARWALNQSIRYLRRALGRAAVLSRGQNDIELNTTLVRCDAVAFETACEVGAWGEAVAMCTGELLPGLYPGGAPELDQWLDAQRDRLRHLAARAVAARSEELLSGGDVTGAAESARQAVRLVPDDETRVRRLIEVLSAAGDRAGAVQAYENYASWLQRELDLEPAPATRALIDALQADDKSAVRPAGRRSRWPSDAPKVAAVPPLATTHVRRGWSQARVGMAVGALALVAVAVVWTSTRAAHSGVTSLAIVPCASTATDSLAAYRAVLMTEDLTAAAAKSRLFDKVIAFQSAALYRGTTKRPTEIRRELGVDALLFCRYEATAPVERLRVQLVDGRTSALLWADQFDRDVAIPDAASLPTLVVHGLRDYAPAGRVMLQVPPARLPSHDLKAVALYTEGRYYVARQTESSVRQGIARFEQAIRRDPSFALAHAGLSRAYFTLGTGYGSMEPREAFPAMKHAAERALALDSTLGEAHELLAEYDMNFGWDWAAADEHLREAIRLDPYMPRVLQMRAYFLTLFGRSTEALSLDAEALDLSPVDPMTWTDAASHRVLAGRPDEALPFVRRGLELGPDFPPILLVAGGLYAETGRPDQGIAYLRRADSMSGGQAILRGRLAYAYALAGDSANADPILRELKRDAAVASPPAKTATAIAVVYIGLGERDSAFAWLETAYREHSGNLAHVLRTPAGWRLAGDRRYLDLMRRIGLPPEHPSLDEFRSRGRIVFESSEASPPLTTGRRPR